MESDALGLSKRRLAAVISGLLAPAVTFVPAAGFAQQLQPPSENPMEQVIVTALRRANSVQDIPLNITAVPAALIEERRLTGVDEISRFVPGLAVTDLGPRDEFPNLVVRGLNTSSVGPIFPRSVSVATYLGEIPMQADFRTQDLERVEVLIGPQGTLYGSGTLGGTIRYIPMRPQVDAFDAQLRGRVYTVEQAESSGQEGGFMLNVPIIDQSLAIRASVDYLDDPGYIDYPYIVREGGVSNPQPDFSDPDAVASNLVKVEDVDFEQTLSGRVALRWTPIDAVDATLTYHYQQVETGGRSLQTMDAIGTGPYEAGYRYEEPSKNRNELLSLELTADLGFAELTSATGRTRYKQSGQRDQTDLLLNFEYYYETFPFFSAFTRELDDEKSLVQEFRLVSTGSGNLSWIGGLFYDKFEGYQTSREFTPHFDQWAVDNLGGVSLRPDALEYLEVTDEELIEQALYGEVNYTLNQWQFTVGTRLYKFEASNTAGIALPLFETVYFGAPPDSIPLELDGNATDDSGSLFKLNVSRYFGEDVLGYVTVSEGYRVGGVNPIKECTPDDLQDPTQAVCALPDEVLVKPDKTTNYEIGLHSTLLGGSLFVNAAVYHIDWEDIQVADVTLNGSLPITSNGSSATSDGFEIAGQWQVGDHWRLSGTYAYTSAELAEGTDAILGGRETGPLFTPKGSRLPGSPEHQASLGASYSTDFGNGFGLDIGYNIAYTGDILSSIGAEQVPSVAPWHGEKIPSFALHQLTARLSMNQWTASFFVDNLLDEYYFTSVRSSQRLLEENRHYLDAPTNINGFLLRSYARYVGKPRTVGFGFTYNF